MLYLRKFLLQHLFGSKRNLHALAQRTARRKSHLHGKVTLIESWYKLGSKSCEQQEGCGKQCKRRSQCPPQMRHARMQRLVIHFRELGKEPVGKSGFQRYFPFKERRSHHRHIGERENQCTHDAEHKCLCHRGEIFALNASESKYWEKHYQYYQHGKCRAFDHLGSSLFHLVAHFLGGQFSSCQSL